MKGWYGNKQQHCLASMGIRTKEIKDIIQYPDIINYLSSEEIIIGFWNASVNNDFSRFNFDKAFENLEDEMTDYVKEHGRNEYGYNGKYIDDIINKKIDIDDCEFNIASILCIVEIRNIKSRKNGIYTFDNEKYYTKKEFDILLMDRIIDLQHRSGSVLKDNEFEFINIEKLRKKFEETSRRIQ